MKVYQMIALPLMALYISNFESTADKEYKILFATPATQGEAREIKTNFSKDFPDLELLVYYREPYFFIETLQCAPKARIDSSFQLIRSRYPKAAVKLCDETR